MESDVGGVPDEPRWRNPVPAFASFEITVVSSRKIRPAGKLSYGLGIMVVVVACFDVVGGRDLFFFFFFVGGTWV